MQEREGNRDSEIDRERKTDRHRQTKKREREAERDGQAGKDRAKDRPGVGGGAERGAGDTKTDTEKRVRDTEFRGGKVIITRIQNLFEF